MLKWVYLAVGGVAGTFSRYWLAGAVYKKLGTSFPSGTLVVNLSGCLLIGFFNSLAEDKLLLGPTERLLLITGFCGAYTTFSTFILETSHLAADGEFLYSLVNVVLSVAAGFVLFRLGAWVGKVI